MRFKLVVAGLSGLFMAGMALAQAPAAPAASPPDPQNVLNLDLSTGGRVKVLLRPDKAPISVDRIKTLVRRHFYDGLTFHRVIEGFMAQGGDPKGTGEGGSDLPDIKGEFNDMPHVRGVMAMARAEGPDTANSQFFIMLQPNLALDGNYAPVGRVFDGMQYVDAIEKGEPPEHPSKILRATIESDELGLAPVATPIPDAQPTPPAPLTKAQRKAKEMEAKRDAKAARRQEKERRKEEEERAKDTAKAAKESGAATKPVPAAPKPEAAAVPSPEASGAEAGPSTAAAVDAVADAAATPPHN